MKIAKRLTGSFRYGQKGFTLVELLIVIAILGILAAVAIPNLVSFIGEGETEALATENDVVQMAMIAVMASNGISWVDQELTGVTDLTAGEPGWTGKAGGDQDFDDFLINPNPDGKYTYTWTSGGVVNVALTP